MPSPMIIPFDLGNAGAMVRAMSSVADKTQVMARGYQQALGPAQRLVQAQMQLRNAGLFGSGAQQFDAQYRLLSAQKSYSRAQRQINGPDLGQALKNAIMSTRFGVGGQGLEIMPLIGRTMAALSESGPWGMAIAAGVAAVTGFAMATSKAAQAATEFAKAALSIGATPAEQGRLGSLGGALGINGAQMASLAQQFAQELATNPYVMGFGMRNGISDPLGNTPYGRLDQAKALLQAAEALRKMPREEAIRMARSSPALQALLPIVNLSKSSFERMKGDANVKANVFNPRFLAQAQEFTFAASRLSDSFMNLLASVSGPMLTRLTGFFNSLADTFNGVADWFANHQAIVRLIDDFFGAIRAAVTMQPRAFMAEIRSLYKDVQDLQNPQKDRAPQDRQRRSTDANTDAIKELIGTLRGTYGGGARARGAYPAQGGLQWNNPAIRDSIALGAFSL